MKAAHGDPESFGQVEAEPRNWPRSGRFHAKQTALLSIDWQVDFCGEGGYVDLMGYDISLTRTGLAPAASVLEVSRAVGLHVIHTREGHRTDLSDCPPNKLWRSQQSGAGIGSEGPNGRILVRGEPGWQIVSELAPIPGELVVDKPGKGAFFATDLDAILRARDIRQLVITGITTDVCVHTTMREATDLGYDCLLLSDCTSATTHANYAAALAMVRMERGIFGATATSAEFFEALNTSGPARSYSSTQ